MPEYRQTDPPADVDEAIATLGPWFHNLHLPDGRQTAPDHFLGDFPSYKWNELASVLPEDLSGWTALDVGCNAGYYTFELSRRGADVVGVDVDEHYLAQARWASRQFADLPGKVSFRHMQVYDLARTEMQYDLVLFLGVLYHLRYPLLGLDIVSRTARKILAVQTMTMPGMEVIENTDGLSLDDRSSMTRPGWPKMAFIEHRLQDDPTNWWAPNHACVEAMLRSAGMTVTARPGEEMYLCEPDLNASEALRWQGPELAAATGR